MPEADRADLLATMVDEAERLNRFIANLLDMTRLESGAVEPNASLLFLADVVETTLRRARKILARHQVEVSLPPDLPMLSLDHVLIEQVLFNLIDNATKYAPPGSTLRLRGWVDGETARLEVMDEGPGIPEDSLERIFNSFYRVGKTDTVRAGTGLGLSICRGFVEAMGGAITARNRADRSGAIFTMGFPIPSDRPRMDGLP